MATADEQKAREMVDDHEERIGRLEMLLDELLDQKKDSKKK